MLTETTVSKLREMRLSVMVNALKDQLADPQFQSMAFEDRLGLLVDAEWNARKNNHLNKLIRQATFSDPGACLENVEYLPDRGLKQEELLRFGTCNYIQDVRRHASIKTDDTIQSEKYALANIKYFPEQSSGKRLSGKPQFINCAHNHIGINGYFLELST